METLEALEIECNLIEDYYGQEPMPVKVVSGDEEKKEPDFSISLSDVDDDVDSDYNVEEVERINKRYSLLLKVGGAPMKKIYDDVTTTAGVGGTSFEDLSYNDHCLCADVADMKGALEDTNSKPQRMIGLLSSLHYSAKYALSRIAHYRASHPATEAELSRRTMDENVGLHSYIPIVLLDSTPGIRRSLRALARTRRMNRERIQRGDKPVVGGKEVSDTTFKKLTGKDPAEVRKSHESDLISYVCQEAKLSPHIVEMLVEVVVDPLCEYYDQKKKKRKAKIIVTGEKKIVSHNK